MAVAAISNERRRSRAVIAALCLGLLTMSSSYSFAVNGNMPGHEPPMAVSASLQELETANVDWPPTKVESVALLKINDESTLIAAGVIPGAVGFFLGNSIWFGVALFVVGAWAARQPNELGEVLKGTSKVSMGAVNFGAKIVGKYQIGDKISNAFNTTLEKSGNEEAKKISEAVGKVQNIFANMDEEVGITSTLGGFFGTGGELASKAVDKVVKVNDDLKLAEKLQQKFDEAVAKATETQEERRNRSLMNPLFADMF